MGDEEGGEGNEPEDEAGQTAERKPKKHHLYCLTDAASIRFVTMRELSLEEWTEQELVFSRTKNREYDPLVSLTCSQNLFSCHVKILQEKCRPCVLLLDPCSTGKPSEHEISESVRHVFGS